ncbi:MAG: hypothetical protein EZS28_005564 [Streblomastix strix]|uniref:Uncharacterized protein n=1 Tax=Streblomastix strix TaxID=222440 RepID=A0A5J4WWI7_9EUKA|nr:MAG: hypothetical protein EZS28_005564 [Streblomastix strix]
MKEKENKYKSKDKLEIEAAVSAFQILTKSNPPQLPKTLQYAFIMLQLAEDEATQAEDYASLNNEIQEMILDIAGILNLTLAPQLVEYRKQVKEFEEFEEEQKRKDLKQGENQSTEKVKQM